MITLICGGRTFNDHYKFDEAMKLLPFEPTVVVDGEADGADSMASNWAKRNGIYSVRIGALWNYYGNAAGGKRNQAMLDIMKIEYCIALPGGSGTNDMVERCILNNIPVWRPYR